MPDKWSRHPLADADRFEVRRPVLDAMPSLRDRWRRSEDGKALEVDLPLSDYSPHERAIIEFAIDPYFTAQNIFQGLDLPARKALAKAIHQLFG
jgi:hypothetical protein